MMMMMMMMMMMLMMMMLMIIMTMMMTMTLLIMMMIIMLMLIMLMMTIMTIMTMMTVRMMRMLELTPYKNKFEDKRIYIGRYGDLSFPQFVELVIKQKSLVCVGRRACRIDRMNVHWLPLSLSRCG